MHEDKTDRKKGLNIMYTESKESQYLQSARIDSLETKSIFALGFLLLSVILLTTSDWFTHLQYYLLIVILVPLFFATGFLIRAILIKNFYRDPDPFQLTGNYIDSGEEEAKTELIRNYTHNYALNENIINDKKAAMNNGITAICITIFFLLIIIIYTTISPDLKALFT
jgi:hypothetical protein